MPENIVVLDGFALNPGDLSWDALAAIGPLKVYDRTPNAEIVSRADGATAILTNKTPLSTGTLSQLPRLRYIGVLATGYDIVDIRAARERGITVANIPTYGTHSVAQFTFALLLELCHHVQRHSDDVHAGGWTASPDWSYHITPLAELAGKTMGVVGFGRIGQQTAEISRAFGMEVLAHDPVAKDSAELVDLRTLMAAADVISLHCPLTAENRGLINRERLGWMKPTAILINTARGPLVVEEDLAEALNSGRIGGAALDVLTTEPPQTSPLFGVKNCILTPHIAWATREARQRLMSVAVENLSAFISGHPQNVVS